MPRAEKLRQYIDSTVHDKSVAEKLKPWYGGWCKRPAFHDEYLDIFNRDNVTLVDTDGKGIDRYSEKGLVANGEEYEVDLIVFATGFTVAGHKGGCPSQQTRAPIIGRDGRDLEDKWMGPDFGTLFGSATNGFPNYFFPGVSPHVSSHSEGGTIVTMEETVLNSVQLDSQSVPAPHPTSRPRPT